MFFLSEYCFGVFYIYFFIYFNIGLDLFFIFGGRCLILYSLFFCLRVQWDGVFVRFLDISFFILYSGGQIKVLGGDVFVSGYGVKFWWVWDRVLVFCFC